jgi:hypothetical protein
MPKWDSRLIGTWKSDRRRTFTHWRPRKSSSSKSYEKLKSLFGKLQIRWARGKYYTDFDGVKDTHSYEILAVDRQSVVIRISEANLVFDELVQIRFDGDDRYWIALGNGLCEYFKRVKDSQQR